MLASELLDGLEALSDGPRHPIAPWFVRVLEPAFRHHALDRGHATSLPMADTEASYVVALAAAQKVRSDVRGHVKVLAGGQERSSRVVGR